MILRERLRVSVVDPRPAGKDTAGVVARPPVVFLGSILVAVGLNSVWPVKVSSNPLAPVGWFVVLLAIVLFALSAREFAKVGTPLPTQQPTTALVTTGPYRFSRNPVYLSFVLFQVGLGVWINNAWILAMLIPAIALISYGVIAREEQYLVRKFSVEYLRYRRSVRRWL